MNKIQSSTNSTERPKWGKVEKESWLANQTIKRSYQDEVVERILQLKSEFEIIQYGHLTYAPEKYPLYLIKTKTWIASMPTVLITGGVHGYETSGVQGAIRFLETKAGKYAKQFNFIVAPCISPWGFETINRWNPFCVDPNRSFYAENLANQTSDQHCSEEANNLMKALHDIRDKICAHIDLHETTDSDNNEFIPALNARDGKVSKIRETPDGFYLVDDSEKPQSECTKYIIEQVEKVTHIAPADDQGCIIGSSLSQRGVINYALQSLGLCAGMTQASYRITTEVYPDSPNANDEICIQAQVISVTSMLEHLIEIS